MKNLTFIVAVALSSMVVAQPGKGNGDHSDKNKKNESFGNQLYNKNQGHRENKGQRNVFIADQGKKGKGGKGNNGGPGNHKNNKNVFHQDKGHGSNGGKSHHVNYPGNNKGKQFKDHGDNKHFKGNKGNGHKGNGHYYKGKPGKIHYVKGHPNFGYVYVNHPVYYTGTNYGQWRSKEARKKHKHYHPVYEYQAIEGYNLIVGRNSYLFVETDNKINLLRLRLADRRKAGLITVVEYDNNIRTIEMIEMIERRRAAIEVNVML